MVLRHTDKPRTDYYELLNTSISAISQGKPSNKGHDKYLIPKAYIKILRRDAKFKERIGLSREYYWEKAYQALG